MGKDRQTKLTQISGERRKSDVNVGKREWLVLEPDLKEEELKTSTCFLLTCNRVVGFKPILFACISHILVRHTLPPI